LEWSILKNIKELQNFLGLGNYYRKFIKNFAEIIELLRKLLKKNADYLWNEVANNSFNKLKNAFLNNEVLIFLDPEKEFIVETDSSDFAVGCILSQVSPKDNLLHPVAFYTHSMNKVEVNYITYDKELLAIITASDLWRHHLEGAKYPVQILTDHRNLLYMKKPQHLNQKQIRWRLFLSKFDFRIAYRPGVSCGKQDFLSRRPDYKKSNYLEGSSVINGDVFCCIIDRNINNLKESQLSDKFCQDTIRKIKGKSGKVKNSIFSFIKDIKILS